MEDEHRWLQARLLAFLVGTVLVVVGDALYGIGYYASQVTEPWRYHLSALMGVAGGALYLVGGPGIAAFVRERGSQRVIALAIQVFGFMVAVVHAYAEATMVVHNVVLASPASPELTTIVESLDAGYGLLSVPMFAALLVGYGWLGVEIACGRSHLPRALALLNPLLLTLPQLLLSEQLWYPLRSPALMGAAFQLVLLAYLARVPAD